MKELLLTKSTASAKVFQTLLLCQNRGSRTPLEKSDTLSYKEYLVLVLKKILRLKVLKAYTGEILIVNSADGKVN